MPKKQPVVYNCQSCLYITDNKKDYSRHLDTRKHQSSENNVVIVDKNTCEKCDKTFKYRTSIYRHKKICCGVPAHPVTTPPVPETPPIMIQSFTPEQINYILMENKILKELLINKISSSSSTTPVSIHSV